MRFGMVTTFYPPFSYGGDATYVRSLSKTLVELGHEVEVIASTDAYLLHSKPPTEAEQMVDQGVLVHRLRHPTGLLAALASHQTGHPALYSAALKNFFAKRFDVLHFHNISLMGAPGVLGMGQAKARLLSLHDHWLICPTHVLWKNRSRACDRRACFTCSIRSRVPPQLWRYTRLRTRSLGTIDRILAPSRFVAKMHKANGIQEPIDVLPLYSAVDGPSDQPAVQTNRVVYVGRIAELKGVAELLRVVAKMPEVELVVIGDGELGSALNDAYALNTNIRFMGRMDQGALAREYASAAAVIVPSLVPETFGLSLVEGAACGTPAIVSKGAGGAAELVMNSGGGLLYDGPQELAGAIRRMVQNPSLRNRLGAVAKEAYQSRYTREHHVAAYLRIVADVVNTGV